MFHRIFSRDRRRSLRGRRAPATEWRHGASLQAEALEARLPLAADVVVSEFMAANQTTLADGFRAYSDWIELWNRGDAAADLGGYALTDDPDNLSKWSFPAGTTLAPDQYLIVFASGLDTIDANGNLHTNFQLDAAGDYVALADASFHVVSAHGQLGGDFPAQFGDISYGLQGARPNWVATDVPQTISASQTSTVVSTISVSGLSGLLTDVNVILDIDHTWVDDLDVFLVGPAGTRVELFSDVGGSGDNFRGTTLDDQASVSIRDGSAPFSGSFQPIASLSALNGTDPNGNWTLEINDDFPVEGGRLNAWQLDLATSDDAGAGDEEQIGYLLRPTPGGPNSPDVANTGPSIEEVTDRIGLWSDTQDLVVTAEVTAQYGAVDRVQLTWRTNYLDEVTVQMRDDGAGADAIAGDGQYAAVIPQQASDVGDLLRWYVTASDVDGRQSRQPAYLDQSGEDQSPAYFGTVILDPAVDSQLEVFQWFIEPGQERRADTARGARSSVFFHGQLYDNVFVRVRGGSSVGLPKKSYKFDFNTANDFRFDENFGRVTEINLNTTYTNKDYVRQALAFETYDAAGVAGSEAKLVRVERSGDFFAVAAMIEQPDANLLEREGRDPNGALYKMFNTFTSGTSGVEKKTREYEANADLIEFVAEINGRTGDELKNYVLDNVNIPAVLNYLAATVIMQNNDQMAKNYYLYRDSEGTGEWEFLPWDLDLVFGLHFMTNDSILDDVIWADKDAFVTFAGVRIWPSHPFVGDQAHPANRSWNRLIDALYKIPEFREMHLRRLRTLMDELLQPPGTPAEDLYFEARLDEYAGLIAPDVQLDYLAWANPWRWGEDLTMPQAMQRIKDEYLAVRRTHLYETHGVDNLGARDDLAGIPHQQRGDVSVEFGPNIEFDPASGDANEEYFAIVNPNSDAVDLSGWQISGSVRHTLATGTVIPAGGTLFLSPNVRAFRGRATGPAGNQGLLVQQFRGNLSNQGGQLVLSDRGGRIVAQTSYVGTGGSAQHDLRITEINYNPAGAMPQFGELDTDNDGFEFVELTNSGNSAVELAGVKLVELTIDNDQQGISFEFTSGQLAPGERIVVVKNISVFTSRYGAGWNIAGEFQGKLSNGGETLTVLDAANDVIQQFAYADGDAWPALADGGGATLELVDAGQSPDDPGHWRASDRFGGSPAAENQPLVRDIVINEILSATTDPLVDQIELYNAGNQPVDVAGWYLSDSRDVLKFRIPAGQPELAPGEYLVFDERALGFGFRGNDNDDARLVAADPGGRPTRFADYVEFPAAQNGVSFGRWPNGTGELLPMRSVTFGGENSGPLVGLPGDLNQDLVLSAEDIDFLCRNLHDPQPDNAADVDGNGTIDQDDLIMLVVDLMHSAIGDANLDGLFNSSDLVLIFAAGQYEDPLVGNSTWETGDWNCDGDFTSSDLVFALQNSEYAA